LENTAFLAKNENIILGGIGQRKRGKRQISTQVGGRILQPELNRRER
jgi:hypothetical protein